jgi:hypothetical protein
MATAITTVTKTASVVKSTKGSEKKWSEILTMNRRHDLQLPVDIAKYNSAFRRTYKLYQRQQNQTERTWAHKHETWYQDDFIFRNHFLKQLKPITKRFKNIDSLSVQDNDDYEKKENGILNDDELEILSLKKSSTKELPPIKSMKKLPNIQKFPNHENEKPHRKKAVPSKIVCPKVLSDCQPRLGSDHHASFLDVAQRFLNHKPEIIEKGPDYNEKHKRQQKYLKSLIENEQERTRLAAIKFGKDLENEKSKGSDSDDDLGDDDYY